MLSLLFLNDQLKNQYPQRHIRGDKALVVLTTFQFGLGARVLISLWGHLPLSSVGYRAVWEVCPPRAQGGWFGLLAAVPVLCWTGPGKSVLQPVEELSIYLKTLEIFLKDEGN